LVILSCRPAALSPALRIRGQATHEGTTWASRSGSVSVWIAVIAASATVKAMTMTGRPPAVMRTSGTPSMSAGWADPAGHRGEPAAQVFDSAATGPRKPLRRQSDRRSAAAGAVDVALPERDAPMSRYALPQTA
jgi:hypothetical protein